MTVRCFVLAKISPSYSYIDSYKVQEGSTVASVSDAAKELASKYYHWNQDAARVRVKVYEVSLNPTLCSRLRTSIDVPAAHTVARC